MGKGGGGGGQTQSTVTNSNIPEYARPYVESMLGATQNQLFNTSKDSEGNTILGSPKPYQAYGGTYDPSGNMTSYDPSAAVAGFSPMQQMAQNGIYNLQMPGQFDAANQYTADAMQRAANAGYNPGQFTMGQAQAPDVNYYQMNQPQNVQAQYAVQHYLGNAPTANASQMDAAQLGYAPSMEGQTGYAAQLGDANLMNYEQAGITQLGNAPTYQGQQLSYTPQDVGYDRVNAPQLRDLQMQAAGNVGTQSFTQPGAADAYMSSFMQKAIDPQIREAQRQADIQSTKRSAQMGQLGAFGGSREALENAEASRNTEQLKSDIEAKGLQSAYQSAQSQFNTEQQNALNAALANQQVQQQTGVQNLSALLQTQGLGAQTGLTAQQLNQAAGMQTGQFNQQQRYNTSLQNAQLAQQQQLANQSLQGQYGLTQGQMNQNVNLQNAAQRQAANAANQGALNQYGLQQGSMDQQMAMANLANQQQASVNNQALQGQYGLQQGQFNQAANAANQASNNQIALANQALRGQYGLTQGQMSQANAQFNAQQGQAANLANQNMAYNTGLQNLQANLGVQQLGAGQNMQAQLANQQAMLANQQAIEQSRQFGANYGQQMNAQQLAAAQQLGGLGQQQLSAQQGIYGLQNQVGGQQQQQQQQIINQAMQDYSNTQQYPLMQLGTMSNMLRGLPMQAATTNMYQAAPNALTQGIGAVGAYGALNNAFGSPTGRKEGGVIHAAQGGIMSYDVGGEIESTLENMDVDSLKKYAKESSSPSVKKMAMRLIQEKSMPVPHMARGGILAFAKGEEVEGDDLTTLDTKYEPPLPGSITAMTAQEAPVAREMAKELAGINPEAYDPSRTKVVKEGRQFKRVMLDGSPLPTSESAPPPKGIAAAAPPKMTHTAGPALASAPQPSPAAPPAPPAAPTATPTPSGAITNAAPVVSPPAPAAPAGIKLSSAPGYPARVPFQNTPDEQAYVDKAKQAFNYADRPAEEFLKEQNALLKSQGVDVDNKGMQDYRKKIMDERANIDEESKRQKNLRIAEFFANWGSTPGTTLVAGMNALKKSIPTLIEDEKERKKALREADKIIYEIDQADRLERKGNVTAAINRKDEAGKNTQAWMKGLSDVAANQRRDAVTQQGNEANFKSNVFHTETQARIEQARIASAAADRAAARDATDYQKAMGAYQIANDYVAKVRKAIDDAKGDKTYTDAQATIKNMSAIEKPTGPAAKLLEAAKTKVAEMDRGFADRMNEANRMLSVAEARVRANDRGGAVLNTASGASATPVAPPGHTFNGEFTPSGQPIYRDFRGNPVTNG